MFHHTVVKCRSTDMRICVRASIRDRVKIGVRVRVRSRVRRWLNR